MTTRHKLTFAALGAVVVALGLPVVLAALPTNRTRGYFVRRAHVDNPYRVWLAKLVFK